MRTPIADFVQKYAAGGTVRLHMPGHKGRMFLGCEKFDITEIKDADSLFEASGIIAESEKNASALFDTGKTLYSTEGSSLCIRAMTYLAVTNRPVGSLPIIVAARNVHKSYVYASALVDFDTVWLWPEGEYSSLCACNVSASQLADTLSVMPAPPAAVYITSPDYLGGMADIARIAEVCHNYGTILLVDNAHGAYLHFLENAMHPIDLGVDMCCDSAHKTLPVLTGGAYLHIGKNMPAELYGRAREAMALFGSTSPSYLTLASLDMCNQYLAENYREKLAETAGELAKLRVQLRANGWEVAGTDPLKLTIKAPDGVSGDMLAERLRCFGVECEYSDPEYLVMMITPENSREDLDRIVPALGNNVVPARAENTLRPARGERAMSVREALFAPHETVETKNALGRVCASPTVSCPPAIPIAISGEVIGREAIDLFEHYGVKTVDVVAQTVYNDA